MIRGGEAPPPTPPRFAGAPVYSFLFMIRGGEAPPPIPPRLRRRPFTPSCCDQRGRGAPSDTSPVRVARGHAVLLSRGQRVAVVAASIAASGVSGSIEQSGARRRKRPAISVIACRPREVTSAGGRSLITGLAGRPPTTARPVRR